MARINLAFCGDCGLPRDGRDGVFCPACRDWWDRFAGELPLPREATAELPGTAAKIAVMARRRQGRRALWHPGDAQADGR